MMDTNGAPLTDTIVDNVRFSTNRYTNKFK